MMEDVIRDEDVQTYCKQNEFLFTASLPTWLDNAQVNLLEVANLMKCSCFVCSVPLQKVAEWLWSFLALLPMN